MRKKISNIKIDEEIHPREPSRDHVESLASDLEVEAKLPPVLIQKVEYGDSEETILLDGRHTIEAYKKIGEEEVPTEWYKENETLDRNNNYEELRSRAINRNRKHGKKISDSKIEEAIEDFLERRSKDELKGFQKEMAERFKKSEGWVSQKIGRKFKKRIRNRNQEILRLDVESDLSRSKIAEKFDLSAGRVTQILDSLGVKETKKRVHEQGNVEVKPKTLKKFLRQVSKDLKGRNNVARLFINFQDDGLICQDRGPLSVGWISKEKFEEYEPAGHIDIHMYSFYDFLKTASKGANLNEPIELDIGVNKVFLSQELDWKGKESEVNEKEVSIKSNSSWNSLEDENIVKDGDFGFIPENQSVIASYKISKKDISIKKLSDDVFRFKKDGIETKEIFDLEPEIFKGGSGTFNIKFRNFQDTVKSLGECKLVIMDGPIAVTKVEDDLVITHIYPETGFEDKQKRLSDLGW